MITTVEQLRSIYAQPMERALRKQLDHLDAYCQRIIALSPFCVISTAGPQGAMLDASPRGGPRGFVKCADAHHLLLPDAGGNNRLDSFTNLLSDPRIGMLFLVPGVDETLRINGTACLRDEPEYIQQFEGERQLPRLVVEITVQEAYLHCPKALMRSKLWDAGAQIERSELPTLNQIIHAQVGLSTAPESQADMLKRYEQMITEEQGAR